MSYEKHIQLVEAVNNATTETEHFAAELKLRGWREGMEDAGKPVSLMAADSFYLDQGIDRLMCCGVFIDWKPK